MGKIAFGPGGGGGGGVLPMWWVIHMCRGFDPLFLLWQDRARSFWGIFSHPPTPKRSFGVLKLPILTEFDLLGPKFHFSLDLFGSNFQRPAAHPHHFSDQVPPPPAFGPLNSGNLVDRMSGKFQMLNVKTYIGMWNDFGNLTHWGHSHGYRVNENDLQDFQEPDYRQSLTISFSGQKWLNSPYNSLTHVSGQLWEDLERKLPPFGHPQPGIIRQWELQLHFHPPTMSLYKAGDKTW